MNFSLPRRLLAPAAMAAMLFTGCDSVTDSGIADDVGTAVQEQSAVIPGQYIVVLDEAAAGKRMAAVKQELLATPGVSTVLHDYKTFGAFAATMSEKAAKALADDPRVRYVEPDQMVSLGKPCWVTNTCDDGGGGGGGGQETPWGITRVGGAGNGTGTTAWVVDSGVDLDHPDLNVDASCSENFVSKGKDSPDDGNGHGTHVAGTIAALDNGIGVVGVAAGARICAVRVLDNSGSGAYSGVIAGVDYVGANGASGDVANMSLGGPPSPALDAAVVAASAKVTFVLAAGNESTDANNSSPARVNGGNIYTISASDVNDNFASFSNYGNPPVDYAAPGVGVKSTYKGGGYATLNGTSMAAPHVAGILLLGNVGNGGTVNGDPDGKPDTIATR